MGKFLSIILIFIGGGAVSLAGNFVFLFALLHFGFGSPEQETYGFDMIGSLFIFWIIELIIILGYAVYKAVGPKNTSPEDKKSIMKGEAYHRLLLVILFLTIFAALGVGRGLISYYIPMGSFAGIWYYLGPIIHIILLIYIFIKLKKLIPSPDGNIIISTNIATKKVQKSETIDLMTSLAHADIHRIDSVMFIPNGSKGFIIKTSNIKRLTVYISKKMGKTQFEPEELRNIYTHVTQYIDSSIDKKSYNLIAGKMDEFVKKGGKVLINRT